MVKSKDEIDQIVHQYVDLIRKVFYVKKVFLFGSYAEGRARDNSDVDIAVVSPDFDLMPETTALKILFRIARHVDAIIEPVALTEEEINNPMLGSVTIDVVGKGKLIYQEV